MEKKVELGDTVKCCITGVEGVVVAITTYFGSDFISCAVRSKMKDGKILEDQWINGEFLKVDGRMHI